jgi:hypothetical protein
MEQSGKTSSNPDEQTRGVIIPAGDGVPAGSDNDREQTRTPPTDGAVPRFLIVSNTTGGGFLFTTTTTTTPLLYYQQHGTSQW